MIRRKYTLNKEVSKDTVIYDEYVTVVDRHNKKVLFSTMQIFNGDDEDKPLALKEIISEALKNVDNKQNACFLILCESYLDGIIYRYNNYGKYEVVEVGELGGFA